MAVNTTQQGDGQYVTHSSLSITGGPSRSTVKAEDLVGSSTISTPSLAVTAISASAISVVNGTSVNTLVANSTISAVGQVSVGNLQVNSKVTLAGVMISSATTAQSASTAKMLNNQFIFSVLSLTTNGAAIYYRSNNSTYVWASSEVIG